MKYQLVLQWPASSMSDFDRLVRIENELIEKLRGCEVDGHDMGSGESNIFVHTNDPVATFAAARGVISAMGSEDHLRAGYRKFQGESFRVLWPDGIVEFRVS